MKPKVRDILLVVVKLAIAAGLLAIVISRVHWNDYVEEESRDGQTIQTTVPGFKTSLASICVAPVAAAFAAHLVSLMLGAARWRFLLGVQDVEISLWGAIRLTFLGLFFNTVVPGTVGGDLFKVYRAAKHTPNKAGVLVSTFVDRAIGMTELAMLSAVMLIASLAGGLIDPQRLRMPAIAILVIACVLVFAGVFLLSRRFRRIFHLQKLYGRLPISHHIAAAGEAANVFRRHTGKLLAALGITVVCHVFFVLSILLLGVGLSLEVPWAHYFLYVPLIYVIGAVPITPGGIGMVEELYVVFFAINPSGILALALLARVMPMILGLPGLWVFLSGPRPPKASQIKQELAIDGSPAASAEP